MWQSSLLSRQTAQLAVIIWVEENRKGELTAIIEKAPGGGYWAIRPEVPGANGQGETVEEAKGSLQEAVSLILEDHIEDFKRGIAL